MHMVVSEWLMEVVVSYYLAGLMLLGNQVLVFIVECRPLSPFFSV